MDKDIPEEWIIKIIGKKKILIPKKENIIFER